MNSDQAKRITLSITLRWEATCIRQQLLVNSRGIDMTAINEALGLLEYDNIPAPKQPPLFKALVFITGAAVFSYIALYIQIVDKTGVGAFTDVKWWAVVAMGLVGGLLVLKRELP